MPNEPDANGDAYRTLGLEPGASRAEVKRAYRLLAKAFHPDSAGEAALPRFLAIHEAYDRLTTGRVSTGGARAPRPAAPTPPEPWRADPARARQARERARSTRAGPDRSSTGTAGASPGTGAASGSTGASSTGSRASSGTRGTGRRHVRKATMGSTSYDEARDANDPTWSGASWYGPSSGEYWIVNPREYADPRKHGPAYQSRARRPLVGDADDAPFEAPVGAAATAAVTGAPERPAAEWTAPTPQAGAAVRPSRWGSSPSASAWSAPAGDRSAPSRAAPRRAGANLPTDPAESGAPRAPGARTWLGGSTDDPIHRLGLALVAWPPIGIVAAATIGDATGCATYSAACGGVEPILPWLAQAAILGLLLLLPSLARILAGGAIAMVLLLVPVTLFLVAIGGAGAAQLGFVSSVFLGVAWLVGVVWSAWSARTAGELGGGGSGA